VAAAPLSHTCTTPKTPERYRSHSTPHTYECHTTGICRRPIYLIFASSSVCKLDDAYLLLRVRRRRAFQHGPQQDHDLRFKSHVLSGKRQTVGGVLTRYMARACYWNYSVHACILPEGFRSFVSLWGQNPKLSRVAAVHRYP
jgi:hypothetical protein